MEIGNTFKIFGEDEHLWMIISDPKQNPDQVVLVNFTSWQYIHDQTCIVNVGEHPSLATRSLVYYPEPMIRTLVNLQKSEKYGLLKHYPDLSAELLKRIQRGPSVPDSFR